MHRFIPASSCDLCNFNNQVSASVCSVYNSPPPHVRDIFKTIKQSRVNEFSVAEQAMIGLFQQHVAAEMKGNIETTMATMTDEPHLNHVPTMAGGTGAKKCAIFTLLTL